MEFELTLFNDAIIQKQAVNEVIQCNDVTINYGLVLTQEQALELVETRSLALKENDRIEFGGGIIEKIIYEFCDSPYITKYNYEETIHGLVETFYYYKGETLDLINDDDLVKYMKTSFNGVCNGSLELLFGRELHTLAHTLRCGYAQDHVEETDVAEEEDDEEDDEDGEN